jgi:hypothetical protein
MQREVKTRRRPHSSAGLTPSKLTIDEPDGVLLVGTPRLQTPIG